MKNHRAVGKLDERLREGEGEGPQSGAKATDEDEGYQLSTGEVGWQIWASYIPFIFDCSGREKL